MTPDARQGRVERSRKGYLARTNKRGGPDRGIYHFRRRRGRLVLLAHVRSAPIPRRTSPSGTAAKEGGSVLSSRQRRVPRRCAQREGEKLAVAAPGRDCVKASSFPARPPLGLSGEKWGESSDSHIISAPRNRAPVGAPLGRVALAPVGASDAEIDGEDADASSTIVQLEGEDADRRSPGSGEDAERRSSNGEDANRRSPKTGEDAERRSHTGGAACRRSPRSGADAETRPSFKPDEDAERRSSTGEDAERRSHKGGAARRRSPRSGADA